MRGRRKQEEPLVEDLVARLRVYRTNGAVCRCCRTWISNDDKTVADWWQFAGDLYCPTCARDELGVQGSMPPGAA